MQNPSPPEFSYPTSNPTTHGTLPSMPPKKKSLVLPILLGCGCGLPILAVAGLMIIGLVFGNSNQSNRAGNTSNPTQSNAPTTTASLAPYLGKWQGSDGTSLWIRGDGKGDYDGGNKKITGGSATVDGNAKTLTISFFLFSKTFKIDKTPQTKNGQTEMTLDGVAYRRTSGFDSSNDSSSSDSSGSDAGTPPSNTDFDPNSPPSSDEQRRLARETLLQFDRAVGSNDFTEFHKYCSKAWQEQSTPQQMRTSFKGFVDKKIRISTALNLQPIFSPAPRIDDRGWLLLEGHYPSKPLKTYFKLGYIEENQQWKLASIHVKTGDPIE